MKAVWDNNGISLRGETEEEVDALRSFYRYIFVELKGLNLLLASGGTKDLFPLLNLPEPVNN